MLTLADISFSYAEKPVFTTFSAAFPLGKAYVISGPSGCGKTTLLRLLAGLETPTTGIIHRPDGQITMLFQENRLLPWLTVRQNVALVLPTPDEALIDWCLSAVELTANAEDFPATLSGGMQRRVALARALAYGGDILLLDEPFTGLDDALKVHIAAKFKERFANKTVFLVTHSADEAALFDAQTVTL